ncbi:hypothetical protein MPSEU_000038900 [Mayamaea pseudoterrestris]|nr:hypothetical protein MPSEU_000038900 [Mayamaea pseudoterrestris]
MPSVSRRAKALLFILAIFIWTKVIWEFGQNLQQLSAISSNGTRTRLSYDLSSFQQASSASSTSQCAYAFVIGGCKVDDTSCDGFIYNILVAAHILREEGSTQNIVAIFQMSINSTSASLAAKHTRALTDMNVRIRYIPPSPLESFFDTVINKFKILQLTEYKRVLLMDGDVMPMGNMDYLFDLSLHGTLKENVVVAGALEPANGGFFMLKPGDYDSLLKVIRRREESSIDNNYQFDELRGWGHTIQMPDEWVARRPGVRGTNWTFHFAFSDQGLLYYWTKYYKRSVSIVFPDKVENWAANDKGEVYLQSILSNPFANYSKPRIHVTTACRKFMCDFMHFVGSKKPWLKRPPKGISHTTRNTDAYHIWWYALMRVNDKLDLQLDFAHWKVWQQPPLGGYATRSDLEKHGRAMANERIEKLL